jgi:transposase-like protein
MDQQYTLAIALQEITTLRSRLNKALALRDCSRKWTMHIRDWEMALNQFIIKFDLELSEINKG